VVLDEQYDEAIFLKEHAPEAKAGVDDHIQASDGDTQANDLHAAAEDAGRLLITRETNCVFGRQIPSENDSNMNPPL
jgi:hypothetical protein